MLSVSGLGISSCGNLGCMPNIFSTVSLSTSWYMLEKALRIWWIGHVLIYHGMLALKLMERKEHWNSRGNLLYIVHVSPLSDLSLEELLICYSHQDAEGVIVLNIASYMGGVDLWQNDNEHDDDFSLQSMHDQTLEVVCISGTWHLGKLQVNIICMVNMLLTYSLLLFSAYSYCCLRSSISWICMTAW